jgi:catechol 2,3-dioxygenase-like lactoylglutathione lyase family enzyme
MRVKRIVANIYTEDVESAQAFYRDILGLDVLMDMGWIATYGSDEKTTPQISFASEGGSGTPTPDLSIEVDDLDAVLERVKKAGLPLAYGPIEEPWGVRRFYVRDPYGKLLNILSHTDAS